MLLNYNKLSSQFKFRKNVTGIIHIGGHTGEEFDDYCRGGVENLIAFEPQKWCYDKMVRKILDGTIQKRICSILL